LTNGVHGENERLAYHSIISRKEILKFFNLQKTPIRIYFSLGQKMAYACTVR
jgi:hypothetical protein